jgi:uncharacterized protein
VDVNAPFDLLITGDAALAGALLLGVAFGWFLERGGMGDARRIAAQFYLTDLALLKVMFAAIVTAGAGAFWLARVGWLDLGRVYVPETFLLPQIAGGLVFGAGFVIGGLCPGTSCVAAATGRLDGLAVVAGMMLGILGYGVAFPTIEALHTSTALGPATLPGTFGIPHGVAVLGLVVVALACFVAAEWIEARRPRGAPPHQRSAVRGAMEWPDAAMRRRGAALAAVALLLGAAAALAGDPAAGGALPPAEPAAAAVPTVDAVTLAERIRAREEGLRVLDVQKDGESAPLQIPTAVHVTADTVERIARGGSIVVYGNEPEPAARLTLTLRARGDEAVVLEGGVGAWIDEVLEPKLYLDATAADTQAYRRAAPVSRYFGGQPRASVARPAADSASRAESAAAAAARIRRRGCSDE